MCIYLGSSFFSFFSFCGVCFLFARNSSRDMKPVLSTGIIIEALTSSHNHFSFR